MAPSMRDWIGNWQPGREEVADHVDPARLHALAATLDLAETPVDVVPPLWHWLYCQSPWPATDDLGEDGHPADGPFLPPIPHRRRMFAGGRLNVTAPLTVGEPVHRRAETVDVAVKHGRSGEMLFVTVRHEYRQRGVVRIIEEQELVYRSDTSGAPAVDVNRNPLGELTTPWSSLPRFSPPLLFRFSALTANAHRIHYDADYATAVEGFPALVVQGPLLAVHMAELVRIHAAGRAVAAVTFRLQRPVFLGDVVRVEGSPTADGAELAVVSGSGVTHASAAVTFAS
ncbi:MaoC family dehydratase N-terminal domain-containing protein [Mycolicibacterium sp. lyk4-40-TYG-92]|uniref:FAS1-like dehydratase domain-containing protein n=1 Tax=Mycolicibacterium sp. lyk4-40-TYG-92 TaxID=3040295 RepID=UPI00254FFFAD|nr:MaoC family dehydratase N-terminal domain-containing protein [Mycolicibacterium sp. lyk4-40-TYG-92]